MTTTPGAVMLAYSIDLRVRVLATIDAGDSTAEVAEAFSVSPAWVRRLVQRRRETGEVAPRAARDTRVPKLRGHLPRIRALLAATPDMTLAELRDELRVAVALSTLWAAVRSLGLTFEKSGPGGRAGPAGRAGRPRRLAAGGRAGPRPEPGRVRG
jgi:transposase